jgi:transcriptional regulator with XRE-family HTH domain
MDPLSKEFVRMVKQSGWTQKEVAQQLRLTEGAISHIMTGRNRASETVMHLFRLIAPGVAGPETRANAWEEDFLRKLRALKPAQRARVLGALDAMIGAVKQ